MLVPENSVSEESSINAATASGDNVSMEDLAATTEEQRDSSDIKERGSGETEGQSEEIKSTTKIMNETTTISNNNGVSKSEELPARRTL